jgi:hypothetical protein
MRASAERLNIQERLLDIFCMQVQRAQNPAFNKQERLPDAICVRCRELKFQRWSSEADAFEGLTGQQQPGVHSPTQHPAERLLGEDHFLSEKHSELPRF